MTTGQRLELALQHYGAGHLVEAEGLCRQVLTEEPKNADGLHLLGIIAHQMGRHSTAAQLVTRAIAFNPNVPAYHNNLGLMLLATGQQDEAAESFAAAVRLNPEYANAHYNIAKVRQDQGRLEEAIDAFQAAIRIRPAYEDAYINLGTSLQLVGRIDAATEAYLAALRINQDNVAAQNNLGVLYSQQGQLDKAVTAFEAAIRLAPLVASAHNNLGNVRKDQGLIDDAITCYRRALELEPAWSHAHSNLIFAMHYSPQLDSQAIFKELCSWNARHCRPLAVSIKPHSNDRSPGRRLRVGYLSPHLREHVIGWYLRPVLERHDRQQVQVVCFSNSTVDDRFTSRLRSLADEWHNIAAMSDEHVAEFIRLQRIDILVDLALHTDQNRLMVFAHKPAPVQVTWLGYPGSSGLETMDYRISDPYLDSPDKGDACYSEQTVRLPDCFWCYPPPDEDPPVNELPALGTGRVTFGCLNNFCKINDRVLKLWGQVMNTVPKSRLILLSDPGPHQDRTIAVMEKMDIEPARIEFTPRQIRAEFLRLNHRIDIALDTFPYTGHTTSFDSTWMGVPVISLIGETAVSRAGFSLASNLGLQDLTTEFTEEYVKIAASLAGDLPRLREIRSTLRQRMRSSPPLNATGFTRNLEAAYRNMWQRWCTS